MPDSDKPAGDGSAPQPPGPQPGPTGPLPETLSTGRARAPGKWGDLGTRLVSAFVMLAITLAALWSGGAFWTLLVMAVSALMGWELARLCAPGIAPTRSVPLAVSFIVPLAILAMPFLSGADMDAVYRAQLLSWAAMLVPLLLGLVLLSGPLLSPAKLIWLGYGAIIAFGGQYFLFTGLDPWGLVWLLAVVAIVMISDVLGYFAGRLIGGPKFWPRISPKKTWSGTVAGWLGAALFGAVVIPRFVTGEQGPNPLGMAAIAVLVAFAGQMGDIAASAIKRRVGVKDASNLIPGHGGFMDRLDAMVAAGAVTNIWLLML